MSNNDKGGPAGAVKLANKARNAAVRELIEQNSDQYKEILAKNRTELGLSPNPDNDKKRKQAEKHVNALNKLGVAVNLDEILQAIG